MAKAKKKPMLVDAVQPDGQYVRCWKEGRELVVQVWLKGRVEGEPDGDWAYPSLFSVVAAVEQGILDTKSDAERGS